MAEKMSDDSLLALIGQYERASLGSSTAVGPSVGGNIKPAGQTMTTLEIDRYNALNAYFGRPMGNEVEDRSQIVLPELRDTVNGSCPRSCACSSVPASRFSSIRKRQAMRIRPSRKRKSSTTCSCGR